MSRGPIISLVSVFFIGMSSPFAFRYFSSISYVMRLSIFNGWFFVFLGLVFGRFINPFDDEIAYHKSFYNENQDDDWGAQAAHFVKTPLMTITLDI